jgi:hypothetical protein
MSHSEFIEFEDGMFIRTDTITQFAQLNNDDKKRWNLIFDPALPGAGYRSRMIEFESNEFFKVQEALKLRR